MLRRSVSWGSLSAAVLCVSVTAAAQVVPQNQSTPIANAIITGSSVPFNNANTNGLLPATNPGFGGNGGLTNGVGISPAQIQSLVNGPQMQSILSNPAAISALAQKLGISANQIQSLQAQASSGTLTSQQIMQLACQLKAVQSGPGDIASIATAMGLSADQTAQIQNISCTPQSSPLPGQAQGLSQPTTPQQSGVPLQSPQLQAPSTAEAKFRGLDVPQVPASPDLTQLTQYGYSIFAQTVSTFAPVENVPVGDDYIIGPDDQLQVLQRGRLNQTTTLQVDRDGSIQVPLVGPIQVAGLSFGQAKKMLEGRLSRIEGTSANVTMGQLRTIQVVVVGQVNQPGVYTVSSLSRISNVLQQAGGISKVGSLRGIELRRHSQLAAVLDLYALLMRGDSSHDVRIENNDVIFVPVIGKIAGVAGDVKVPAIYEINSRSSLGEVLRLAGGVTAFGYAEHVQVERIAFHQRTIVLDVSLDQLRSRRLDIRDGDLIKVFPVLPDHDGIVTLTGNVHRPGEYQWNSLMRVSDLVERGQGLLQHTYFEYALIKRLVGPQKYTHYLPVDLGAALTGGTENPANLLLDQKDELEIFNQDDLRDLPHVTVTGEVRNPGDYPLSQDMRLSDLIYEAGGLKDDANRSNAELARTQVGPDSRTYHTHMSVDLARILGGNGSGDITLKNNDQVFIQFATNWHLPESVQLAGRVGRPGPYVISPGEQLSSVLLRSGGLLPDAFPQGILLIRQSVQKLEQERIDLARTRLSQQMAQYSLTLESASASNANGSSGPSVTAAGIATLQQLLTTASTEKAEGRVVLHFNTLESLSGSPEDVVLEDQDTITIPRRPSSVLVLGQVNNPTAIVARPGMTVADYLYKAGGPTTNGDMDQLMIIRADGSVLTEESIKHGRRESLFPLLPLVSGGLMGRSLSAGDAIYVPDNLADIPRYLNLTEKKDIAQIIASSAQGLAVVGILASQL